jgi:hypothetical protein
MMMQASQGRPARDCLSVETVGASAVGAGVKEREAAVRLDDE